MNSFLRPPSIFQYRPGASPPEPGRSMAGRPFVDDDREERVRNKRLKPSLPSLVLASFSVEQEQGLAVYTPLWGAGIFSPPWSLFLSPTSTGVDSRSISPGAAAAACAAFQFRAPSTPQLDSEAWDAEVWCSTRTELQAPSGTSSDSQCDAVDNRCQLEMLLDQDQLAYRLIYNDLADMIGSSCRQPTTGSSSPSKDSSWSDVRLGVGPETPAQSECVPWREQDYFVEELEGRCSIAHINTPEIQSAAAPFHAVADPEEEEESKTSREFNSLEELTEMVLECGEALVADDGHRASAAVARIQRRSAPGGTHLQRLAHYFALALVARLNSTGADLYSAIRRRDQRAVLEAEEVYNSKDPTAAVAERFGSSVLLDALAGADRVHIVDYGGCGEQQWAALMRALAERPRGPPRLLRITAVEHAQQQPGGGARGGAWETGRRLARAAAAAGIPFQYKALARRWEAVQAADLGLRDDEVLAVSCTFRLRNLLDDSVVLSNPRRTVLQRICAMRPRVLLTAELSLAGNAPFLVARLRECLPSCHSFFRALDATMPRDCTARRIVEEEILGRDVLNMVACEGADRVERPEAYHQWHRRLLNAGFRQLPLDDARFADARTVLAAYHHDWTIGRDEGWLLTGWNGRVHHAYAAWTPADRSSYVAS